LQNNKIDLAQRIKIEWTTWASLAFVAALMEGGVLGVIIKNGFQNQVPDWMLNIAVAVATGAPYFSNLLSFFWVKFSRGKSKAKLISNLAMVFCLASLSISFVSFTATGLVIFLVMLILARVVWSGILTIRSNIWRANYPRRIRGKVTAKLATLAALVMSLSGITVGYVLDWEFDYFRWVFVVFSVFSLVGSYRYRKLAVHRQQQEILSEQGEDKPRSLAKIFLLLNENKSFGKYMLAMFVLGSGNLMFMAPLIIYLNEYTSLLQLEQILITTAIPLALVPFAVRWWATLLDSNHIFHFRSIHSWGFVFALALFLTAQVTGFDWLFFVGSLIYGVAISGAVIGWNLGHNDFVNGNRENPKTGKTSTKEKDNPMDYMAVHVTLTGLRGLLMPIVGISLYQWLETHSPGQGKYALLLPLSLTTLGAVMFVVFNRQRNQQANSSS